MIRRKLFAYTMMFTAGITAGFFILDRAKPAAGTLFMITAGIAAAFFDFGENGKKTKLFGYDEELTGNERTSAAERFAQSLGDVNIKWKLIAFMMAGFCVFTCRFIIYGTGITAELSGGDSNEAADGSDVRVIRGIDHIEGDVLSMVTKEEGIRLVLADTDATRRSVRVQVSYYGDEVFTPENIVGRRITAYGRLKEAPGVENPGCFDYRIYLRSRKIGYLFSARSIDVEEDEIAGESTVEVGEIAGKSNVEVGEIAGKSNVEVDEIAGESNYEVDKIKSAYGCYRRNLFSARERFLDMFVDEDIRGFIKGVVFGDKSDIDEEMLEDFNGNGTGHILAVSGLHTGFLYALLRFLAGRKKTLPVTIATAAVLVMYGDMTMWSPSTMRAVTVLTISMMSIYVRRPFDLLSSVSAAALAMLIIEPYQLFSTGFQMSFLALLGIAFLTGPLSIFIGEGPAVMIAVQAGVLPVTAYCYHRINLLSVFINIPVIFLASILVPVCMAALFISTVTGSVPHILVTVIEGLSELTVNINNTLSMQGYFSNMVTSASPALLVLFYMILFLVSSEWFRIRLIRHERKLICTALFLVIVIAVSLMPATFNVFADDEVVFVSVGQGDCTHIRAGGKDVLIDGGGDSERNIAKDVLIPYLLGNGAERTEFALVTHLHTDHCLGILQLDQIYPVGAVGIPSDYSKAVKKLQDSNDGEANQITMRDAERDLNTVGNTETYHNAAKDTEPNSIEQLIGQMNNIEFVNTGDRINITEDVFIEAIWPPKNHDGGIDMDDANENNMVYMICYKGIKIMITGDLLEEDELEMVDHYRGTDKLKCDVLKVAHHGSKSSSSEAFLDAADPEIAVIEVGRDNLYGHPHEQTLDRLEKRGIKVFRTDLNGAVGIDIRRGRLYVDLNQSAVSSKQE